MKNRLIKIALFFWDLFGFKKNPVGKNRRILIFSTTGFGDTLWGTPAIRAIKKSFPNCYLAILTSPVGRELLKENPHLDKIYTVKDPVFLALPKLLWNLRHEKFDTVLLFHISQRPLPALAYLTGASELFATEGNNKGLDSLFTQLLPKKYQHEIERRLDMIKAIGAEPAGGEMEVHLTEVTKFDYGEKPLIVLHPGAKDKFKQWPVEHFITVGRELAKEAQILVTGSADEVELTEKIAAEIPGAISLGGKLPVRKLAALMSRLKLLITNDTGPMHLAFAMQTPTIAFFAPTDPNLCGPYKIDFAKAFEAKKCCSPCLKKRCRIPFCLHQITPQEVVEYAKNM